MRITKRNTYLREELIWLLWQKRKNTLSMKDVSEIFGICLGNVYRILKKYNEKKNQSDFNLADFIKRSNQIKIKKASL